jgi:hypothetical protein
MDAALNTKIPAPQKTSIPQHTTCSQISVHVSMYVFFLREEFTR